MRDWGSEKDGDWVCVYVDGGAVSWAWDPGILTRPLAQKAPVLISDVTFLKCLIFFEQGASHFQFSLPPANDVADPVGRFLTTQTGWLSHRYCFGWMSDTSVTKPVVHHQAEGTKQQPTSPLGRETLSLTFLISSLRIEGDNAFSPPDIPIMT